MSDVRSIQGLRLLALALAITTWYFVRLEGEGSSSKPVSFANEYTIQYAVPDTLVILESTETVQITIQGRESIVEKFNPFLVRVKVDISVDKADSYQYELTNENVTLPEGLTVTAFEPNVVTVRLDEVATEPKGVIALPQGEPAAGARVKKITTAPQLVNVRGPRSELQEYDAVYTQPIDLNGHAIDFRESSFIVLPSPGLSLPDGNPTVTVFVELEIPGIEDLTPEGEATEDPS